MQREELRHMLDVVARLYALLGPLRLGRPLGSHILEAISDTLVAAAVSARLLRDAARELYALYEKVSLRTHTVEKLEALTAAGYLDVSTTALRIAAGDTPVWLQPARRLEARDSRILCSLLPAARFSASRIEEIVSDSGILGVKDVVGEPRRLLEETKAALEKAVGLHRRICRAQRERMSPCRLPTFCRACRGTLYARYARTVRLLCAVERLLEGIEAVKAAIVSRGAPGGDFLLLYAQRLYELYTLHLLLEALQRYAVTALTPRGERLIAARYDGTILVFYNTRPRVDSTIPSRVALAEPHPTLPRILLETAAGRPDITLVIDKDVALVAEVKYSRSRNYLTLARFKTIAYIHEYDALAGLLVYPGLQSSGEASTLDPDEVETVKLLEAAEKEGLVKLRLYRDAILYILRLVPSPAYYEENIRLTERVIQEVLSSVLNRSSVQQFQ